MAGALLPFSYTTRREGTERAKLRTQSTFTRRPSAIRPGERVLKVPDRRPADQYCDPSAIRPGERVLKGRRSVRVAYSAVPSAIRPGERVLKEDVDRDRSRDSIPSAIRPGERVLKDRMGWSPLHLDVPFSYTTRREGTESPYLDQAWLGAQYPSAIRPGERVLKVDLSLQERVNGALPSAIRPGERVLKERQAAAPSWT